MPSYYEKVSIASNFKYWLLIGGQSSEVALALLTHQSWVQISALPEKFNKVFSLVLQVKLFSYYSTAKSLRSAAPNLSLFQSASRIKSLGREVTAPTIRDHLHRKTRISNWSEMPPLHTWTKVWAKVLEMPTLIERLWKSIGTSEYLPKG